MVRTGRSAIAQQRTRRPVADSNISGCAGNRQAVSWIRPGLLIRSLWALALALVVGVGTLGCGGNDCPTVERWAVLVTVVGGADYVVEQRIGDGSFQPCEDGYRSRCGVQFVGTIEVRATAADGRTASTTVTAPERSDGCGPITQEVVLDLSP